ncbi:hypothetical protein AHAS_Ahas13G0143200 [Arachis hypogaea]|uniref:SUI1 domain-containing protein n=1 Tax=Arachis hypogaea TaxID=3818 RepID=A0A445A5S9_ARAHY|nr:hypothetical protein Ahy_B03g067094 [Arachis hypogaea]
MSEFDTNISTAFDPFAEANADDSGAGAKEYVHVRIQQRNGRKSLTTVQGLKKEFSYTKILKDLKKEFCCNGTVVQDPELGQDFVNETKENRKMFPGVYVRTGHTASGRSKKERFNFPCPSGHSKEGAYQDSWFLRPKPQLAGNSASGSN